jgi:hypothetical protein
MTVNLLAREYKVIEAVQIDVPEIPVTYSGFSRR